MNQGSTPEHIATGRWGENVATEYFVARGYDIVERNWRLDHLEIDLIVRKQQRIVFVEVKTRSKAEYADPLQVITKKKLSNLCRSANAYMRLFNLNFTAQFDIIIISGTPDHYTVEHYADAYFPPMKTY